MTSETIGARLLRLRQAAGLTQRELSCPGVSYAYISRIEADTRQPSVKALRKLAARLGVSAHYLETGSRDVVVTVPFVTAVRMRRALDGQRGAQLARDLLDEAIRAARSEQKDDPAKTAQERSDRSGRHGALNPPDSGSCDGRSEQDASRGGFRGRSRRA